MNVAAGVVVAARDDTVATRICLRHLERLGAVRGDIDGADVVLEAEQHSLLGGDLLGSETTAQAALGLTDYVGAFGAGPARTGLDVGSAAAGFTGALYVLARLRGTERPIVARLSPVRALATLKTIIWAARTRPDEWTGSHVRSRERQIDSGYATRDGRITLDFPFTGQEQWRSFVTTLGLAAGTIEDYDGRWYDTVGWGDDVDEARPTYEQFLRELTTDEAIELIRSCGGSSVRFQTVEECLAHPQSVALGLRGAVSAGLPWSQTRVGDVAAPERVDPQAGRPLAGVRVVDFGVGGVGPFTATLLAWLGADVVKVEAPNEFIHAASVGPMANGVSTTYMAINQGKRSIRLDLKQADDLALARALVADADVVVENFRPGALDRLGLGFDAVRELNPSVVYTSVNGFGAVGPLSGEPCTDPHMQAFSGFAARNADPRDGVPRRLRYYALVDLLTSCAVAEATCAGLLERRREGGAVRVETSMLQAVSDALGGTSAPDPVPNVILGTADGHAAVTCVDDESWRNLVGVAGSPLLGRSVAAAPRRARCAARRDRERAGARLRDPSVRRVDARSRSCRCRVRSGDARRGCDRPARPVVGRGAP